MQTLLEIIQGLDAALLRRLGDVHVAGDGRHAIVCLCFTQPGDDPSSLVREVLPVGLHEQLQALTASGLVGRLHVTVLHLGDELHLLAKTHAGSTAERASWRHSLA